MWAPTPGVLGPDSDQFTFRFNNLVSQLQPSELFLGDSHYIGELCSLAQRKPDYTKLLKSVRVIVENAIDRLKKWYALYTPWRHAIEIHHVIFKIIVHIANIEMEDHPLQTVPHPALWCSSFWELM